MSDSAAAGNAGTLGEFAAAGARADAGSASVEPRNPNLPAPPDDSCEQFQITETACMGTHCAPWPCDPPWAKDTWCIPLLGPPHCIGSLDCQAVETPETKQQVLACLEQYQPCTVDADCQDGLCVIDAHYTKGNCEDGRVRSRCRADDDCRSGNLCIAIQADGKRGCADGAEGSVCNLDSECQSKRCFHQRGAAIVGMCSSGESGAPCVVSNGSCLAGGPCQIIDEGTCIGDAHCVVAATSKPAPSGALCTSGKLGEPCSKDTDCDSGHCPSAIDSVCTAGVVGERCIGPSDCESHYCGPNSKPDYNRSHCTSGEAGDPCREGADCKSTTCDRAPADSPFNLVCAP